MRSRFRCAGSGRRPRGFDSVALRCGRIFVVGTVSGVAPVRQIPDIHALGLQFRLEQRQLFFGNLFAAASAAGCQQLPQKVFGFDPARLTNAKLTGAC